MLGPAAGEKGGAKAGSLLLGFIPLGLFGQVEALICSSQTPEVLIYLPPEFLVDRVRLVCIVKRERMFDAGDLLTVQATFALLVFQRITNFENIQMTHCKTPQQNREISSDTKPACRFLSFFFSVYTEETCRIKQTTIHANVTKYPSFEPNPSHFCSKTDDTLEQFQTEELCVHK